MARALQEITHDALELPRSQRLVLAQLLLNIEDTNATNGVDEAWDQEIRARLTAFDEGRIEAVSFEQIRQSIALRFAR